MAVLKCKMCGGDLSVDPGMKVAVCEYCGTQQTVPTGDDDKKTNLFNRANHLRIANEFDRASAIFENIVNEFPDEAEAYWGLVLCKYGIEYVDDPATGKKIPTCHRTSYESIFDDINYKQALEKADAVARGVYKQEAETINNIQKGILDIVKNEKPFDVFICYKESDDSGSRTQDSVLAQDLYYQLTREGFKVFFSRITLEGKLGTAYEPYIFAALNSAKVMVVIGTKPEYYNAVWVKNEWSRFLDMMRKDKSKTIIPAYRDMDPYDLPDALSMFQAQDMSKLGFMQDLIHGINKLVGRKKEAAPVAPAPVVTPVPVAAPAAASAAHSNVENLLKRGNLALEDSKWREANQFFEQVLNENVEESRAYLGKLMARLQYDKKDKFLTGTKDITEMDNYKKAVRFGSDSFKKTMKNYADAPFYNAAFLKMQKALGEDILHSCIEDYTEAISLFEKVPDYRDSKRKREECIRKIEECREKSYQRACDLLANPRFLGDGNTAKAIFEYLKGYKDSEKKLKECSIVEKQIRDYVCACQDMERNNSVDTLNITLKMFNSLGDFKDSRERAEQCKEKIRQLEEAEKEKLYAEACKDASKWEKFVLQDAIAAFEKIRDYKDAEEQIQACKRKIADIEAKEKGAKRKKTIIAAVALLCVVCGGICAFNYSKKIEIYNSAVEYIGAKDYNRL